jgi:hypothetical protein
VAQVVVQVKLLVEQIQAVVAVLVMVLVLRRQAVQVLLFFAT